MEMKMRRKVLFSVFTLLLISSQAMAQQSQDFGDYVVHYNALNTNLITPQVAQGYGIRRSSSRALLNITILKKVMNNPGTPVLGVVTASGRNLTGQTREIEIREIADKEGAVYYIGELSVRNMETFDFTVNVNPKDSDQELTVKFRQQFYTE
jgi:IMP cyclohydrolase